jgi:hypothetical protein
MMKGTDVLISPPDEKPWTIRRITSAAGAAAPITDQCGIMPMAQVAPDISRSMAASSRRRP